MASGFKAGSIYADITANAASFISGVKSAQSSLTRFTRAAKTAFTKFTSIATLPLKALRTLRASLFSLHSVLLSLGLGFSIKEMAKLAGTAGSLQAAFKNLTQQAGIDTVRFMEDLKEATIGTVSEMKLMEIANMALVTGATKSREQFLIWAKSLRQISKAEGKDYLQLLEQVVGGLAVMRTQTLKYAGVNVDARKANEEYQQSIGAVNRELTDQEKRAALAAAATRELQRMAASLPKDIIDAGDALDRFSAAMKDMLVGIALELEPSMIKLFEFLRVYVPGLVDVARTAITGFINEMKTKSAGEWLILFNQVLKKYIEVIFEIIGRTAAKIPNIVKHIIEVIGVLLIHDVKEWILNIYANVKAGVNMIAAMVKEAVKTLAEEMFDAFMKELVDQLSGLAETLSRHPKTKMLLKAFPFTAPLVDLADQINQVEKVMNLFSAAFGKTTDEIAQDADQKIAIKVTNAFLRFQKEAQQIMTTLDHDIKLNAKMTELEAEKVEKKIIDTVKELQGELGDLGKDLLEEVGPDIKEIGNILATGLMGENTVKKIEAKFQDLWDRLHEKSDENAHALTKSAEEILNEMNAMIERMYAPPERTEPLGLPQYKYKLETPQELMARMTTLESTDSIKKLADQADDFHDRMGIDFSKTILQGITDGFAAGEKPAKVFADVAAAFFRKALSQSIDQLSEEIGPALGDLFKGMGAGTGLGGFAMGLMGIAGTILTNLRGGVSSTLDNVKSVVDQTQVFRGIVAGPSNVAIEQVGSALKDALRQSEVFLERIARAVEGGGSGGGVGSVTGQAVQATQPTMVQ